MMNEKNKWRLTHIIEAIEYIEDFLEGVEKDTFFKDYEKQSAVVRQFEIIGEAANGLDSNIIGANSQIKWHEVISMRNVMIHDYFEVNIDIVWDTAKIDLPDLKKKVKNILFDL